MIKNPFKSRAAAGFLACCTCLFSADARAGDFQSPDILVLGDSQISFGSGPAFVDFLSDLESNCRPNRRQKALLKKLDQSKIAVIGVRSTSLHSWTARGGAAKGSVCDVDKKWKVNAGSYGIVNKTKNQFVQIGQGRNYQFCAAGKAPFETMFNPSYYAPKLLILTFLGNATTRWQTEPDLTRRDVRLTAQQLPDGLPCVFMTTAPAYQPGISAKRFEAQQNLRKAMAREGNRCVFVDGLTEQTMAANHGNKKFFRLRKSGAVKDPFHPNERGARHHLKLVAPKLCEAIFTALDGKRPRG
jgi:lysophospholipase L1-like esterase